LPGPGACAAAVPRHIHRPAAAQAIVFAVLIALFVPPWPLRLLLKTPYLRTIPARMIAFGPRPYRLERAEEHPPA
jgi:hypothetical protein